jgi:uncharacterized protein with GYD domain
MEELIKKLRTKGLAYQGGIADFVALLDWAEEAVKLLKDYDENLNNREQERDESKASGSSVEQVP